MRLANAYGNRHRQSCHATRWQCNKTEKKNIDNNTECGKQTKREMKEKEAFWSKIDQWLSVQAIYDDKVAKRCLFEHISGCCECVCFFFDHNMLETFYMLRNAHSRTWIDCVEQHRFTRCYRKLIVENCLLSHLLLVREWIRFTW